jgi:hypothetical protein
MRVTAEVLEKAGNPAALDFLARLIEFPGVTPADRRKYVELALQRGSVRPEGEREVRGLLEHEGEAAPTWLLAARFNDAAGFPERALACARKAVELAPADPDAPFLLAILLLRDPATAPDGVARLAQLAASDGAAGLKAAQALAGIGGLGEAPRQRAIERLKKEKALAPRLAALDLEIGAAPDRRAALIDAAIAALPPGDPEALREMGLWLNARGQAERTLALIPEAEARASRPLFLVRADALAGLRRWSEVDAAVASKDAPLDQGIRELFRARCAEETGDPDRARGHWRAAQAASVGNSEQAMYVARYARQFGRIDQARSIYRNLTQDARVAKAAYLELLQIASAESTAAALDILAEMRQRWPHDIAVRNDHAYFSLLLGREARQARAAAKSLVDEAPWNLAHRTTLALAHLREGNPSDALEAYRGIDLDWRRQPVAHRLIYALVLRENGRAAEAAALLENLPASALRPEERALAGM